MPSNGLYQICSKLPVSCLMAAGFLGWQREREIEITAQAERQGLTIGGC